MGLVYNAIQGVLTILFMVAVGYGLSKRGWFDERDSAFLSRLVLNLALPALMFSNFTRNFDRALILHVGPGLVVPATVILGSYGLAALLGMILRIPVSARGTFRALFSFTNTIFVGLPVNVALFGEQAVPLVTLYYLVNTTLFWTLGVYYIRKDAEEQKAEGSGRRVPFFSWDTVRRIFNPVLVAFFLAIGLVFLEVKLPPFLSASFKYAADMTTPLSMLIIGITVANIGFKGLRFDRYTGAVLVGKFLRGSPDRVDRAFQDRDSGADEESVPRGSFPSRDDPGGHRHQGLWRRPQASEPHGNPHHRLQPGDHPPLHASASLENADHFML
jgi:predicted permease